MPQKPRQTKRKRKADPHWSDFLENPFKPEDPLNAEFRGILAAQKKHEENFRGELEAAFKAKDGKVGHPLTMDFQAVVKAASLFIQGAKRNPAFQQQGVPLATLAFWFVEGTDHKNDGFPVKAKQPFKAFVEFWRHVDSTRHNLWAIMLQQLSKGSAAEMRRQLERHYPDDWAGIPGAPPPSVTEAEVLRHQSEVFLAGVREALGPEATAKLLAHMAQKHGLPVPQPPGQGGQGPGSGAPPSAV